jgi:hypothetical protein
MGNVYLFSPENLKGRNLLRLRWDDDIRMDLRETGWEAVGWIHLAQDMDQWRLL